MNKFSTIVIIILIGLAALYIKENFGDNIGAFINKYTNIEIQRKNPFETKASIPEEKKEIKEIKKKENKKIEKNIKIYFLTLDKNSTPIYKPIKRANIGSESKLEFALKELFKGPDLIEKSKGTYTEIPAKTKLLSIVEEKKKVTINISSDFEYGGGTDSIYSRLMQLIKTSLANSQGKKVYLEIDGKKAEIIGGEGIMITQPLSENSLGE